MVKEQETLAEVQRLINEQCRALQGRLSDTDLAQCKLRDERIRQLLGINPPSCPRNEHVIAEPIKRRGG
jgi:hypothetical protein